ncbi:MAG: restriction endonuclease subunit S [Rubrivivax sp.]
MRSVTEKERAGRLLNKGDLLLEKSGGGELQPVGQVVLYQLDAPAVCSNFVARVALKQGMCAGYWNYVHSAAYAVGVNIGSINQTSGIQNLDQDRYFNERAPFPSEGEQTAIAAFLDRETARIDALIAEQEKLITLLAEKRQAIISNAVTKGLDPGAPTKDSGVAWLGKVPAHWRIGKIQSFARRESGHTPSRQHPEYWENCSIPWFSLADVWQIRDGKAKYVYDTKEKISELGVANSSARLLPAGTVILSRTASVGYSAIMGCDMATTQDFINWVCGPKLMPDFLLHVLRGMRPEFDRLMMGSTHQTIYMPDVAKLLMALPPLHEQEELVDFIERKVADLDALQTESERAAALLKERRSALIAAAVTGQVDVRGD